MLKGYWFFYFLVFCEFKEVISIEGEVLVNNRKVKLIFFYEFVIKGEWLGEVKKKKKRRNLVYIY